MRKLFSQLRPTQFLALGFIFLIGIGTLLLLLPFSHNGKLSFINALFTATSATCVTGLIVEDTPLKFTFFGQLIILFLIQIGGLGFMTMSTFLAIMLGKHLSLKEKLILTENLNYDKIGGIIEIGIAAFTYSIFFELLGMILLFFTFLIYFKGNILKTLWFSIFHSISAYCNAGFSLFSNNLENFKTNIAINLIIISLIIIGGLGFSVIFEISKKGFNFKKYSLHTKLVLYITSFLIIFSTIVILILSWNNFNNLHLTNFSNKLLASFFTAITPRTAGFDTIPINYFPTPIIWFIMLLMLIGASPGSTGGGIKTTTFFILIARSIFLFKGSDDIEIEKKMIPKDIIYKSFAIFIFSNLIIFLAVFFLTYFNSNLKFLDILFEVISAYGTVGLSLGITSKLSTLSKIVIILLMFIGRLGPLTIFFAIKSKEKLPFKYPYGNISVG